MIYSFLLIPDQGLANIVTKVSVASRRLSEHHDLELKLLDELLVKSTAGTCWILVIFRLGISDGFDLWKKDHTRKTLFRKKSI